MFDVGGQRDERRKWIQCFNGETFCFDASALLKRHVPPLLADLLLSSSHLFWLSLIRAAALLSPSQTSLLSSLWWPAAATTWL